MKMNNGISLNELKKLFEYLEEAIKNDKATIVIDNGMCRFLYKFLKQVKEIYEEN